MFLKKFKPTSSGVRWRISQVSTIINSKKYKRLTVGFKKSAGRNITGRITVRSRVGGLSNYILVDFKRCFSGKLAIVLNNVRNSNRNSLVSLIKYSHGGYSYILNAKGVFATFFTKSIWKPERFSTFKYVVGCAVFIKHIPSGSIFFNLEIFEKKGATIARSAGTYCTLLRTNGITNISRIVIPSGKQLNVSSYCLIVLGKNSNPFFYKHVIGKCGRNVLSGFKSKVRGVAMNPVDHPHGGRTKTNSPEVSPWGRVAKFNR